MNREVHSVATTTHGRVLLRRAGAAARGVLAGFHGYLENADVQLARLETIPRADEWTLLSLQGLNRVYRGRTSHVVAGWMTRQDREDAIADNLNYVQAALRLVDAAERTRLVCAGFSQGGAMAFRAGTLAGLPAAGIVAVGSDVPPELLADASLRFPPVLLGRGSDDEWYTAAKFDADVAALRARGAEVEAVVYAGPHEWNDEISAAVGRWLERLR
jgi:predicted esterase